MSHHLIDEFIPDGTYGLLWNENMPRHDFGEDGLCKRLCLDCGDPCYVDAESWEMECAATTGCDYDVELDDEDEAEEGPVSIKPDYPFV